MARSKNSGKGDVQWFLPNRKRPFAWSTMAVNHFICLLAEDGSTVRQCRDKLDTEFEDFGGEATKILDYLIAHGYGDRKNMFRWAK